jgi:DNA-binding transcriptional regulator YiaG
MIGEQLKKIRIEKKISQGGLSALLGVSEHIVNSWETNKSCPTPKMVEFISETLLVSSGHLLKGEI